MACLRVSGAEPIDGLLKNSPFAQRSAGPEAGAANAMPLELRGVFVDQGETFLSIYDPASHAGRWVGLNEAGNPFTVRSYDAAKGLATIEFQGRELSITLKQAKIVNLPPAAVAGLAPAPGAGALPRPGPTATVPAGTPTEEAARLAAIAEEIGRRRALRAQAVRAQGGPGGSLPTPTPTPGPAVTPPK